MSNRKYPYLADKKRYKTNKVCDTCKKQAPGYILEWQVSWFRGEDEIEKICDDCEKIRLLKAGEKEKKQAVIEEKRAEKEAEFWESMKRRLEEKYEVKYLTDYQWRINGEIDLYPVNRRFHILATNKRGDYSDMHEFLAKHYENKTIIVNAKGKLKDGVAIMKFDRKVNVKSGDTLIIKSEVNFPLEEL